MFFRNAGVFKSSRPEGYVGARSCRPCHETFYQKWATSRHGLAMQPYSADLAAKGLTPQAEDVVVGTHRYRADIRGSSGRVLESGPEGNKVYRILYVLGGKNVYCFLTPVEKGRLQTLPLAYDVRKKEWFDTSASGMRHFPGLREEEERVNWKDPLYTFNTSCYSCHVSQLSTNYDLKTDSYHTTWVEPGINCETCHGPGEAHVVLCQESPPGHPPEELKIIRIKTDLTVEQGNASCAPCHAKTGPITAGFGPGDRFFDHYDLVTLESPDFYPDGRDLGENYTYTLWRMNPCAKSGQLDCVHCHSSSGRYKFAEEAKANEACLPCHEERVRNATAHTHHAAGSSGNRCVSCHMPMTVFARMRRSDHSFLPPAPAATIAFQSPNACNICHADKDAAWADQLVRQWRQRDFQAPVLRRARLIAAARKGDWSSLPEMLDYIAGSERDEIFANSLIRLLRTCNDRRKLPVLIKVLGDPSPLVRASAVEALGDLLTPELAPRLAAATRDEYRLVRIRAASVLARVPAETLSAAMRKDVNAAVAEFEASLTARPDDYASYYNLGNFCMERREMDRAIGSFEAALKLQPNFVLALVNSSLAYNAARQNDKAERNLRKALEIDPRNTAANLNLALLLGEQGRLDEGKTALRKVLEADPKSAVAAYNLGVLLANDDPPEAIQWCQRAFRIRPEGKYGYTLAFYLRQTGDVSGAAATLRETIGRNPEYADAYLLLGDIYEQQGKVLQAMEACRQGLRSENMPAGDRVRLRAKLQALSVVR